MRMWLVLCAVAAGLCLAPMASAQDAVKVDPKHYSVVSENGEVRILKVHYGAHEKSVMHHHPDSVAVFLTDGKGTFTAPDGKKTEFDVKAGTTQYTAADTHLPENTSDKAFELILVELKAKAPSKAAAAKPAAAKPAAK